MIFAFLFYMILSHNTSDDIFVGNIFFYPKLIYSKKSTFYGLLIMCSYWSSETIDHLVFIYVLLFLSAYHFFQGLSGALIMILKSNHWAKKFAIKICELHFWPKLPSFFILPTSSINKQRILWAAKKLSN